MAAEGKEMQKAGVGEHPLNNKWSFLVVTFTWDRKYAGDCRTIEEFWRVMTAMEPAIAERRRWQLVPSSIMDRADVADMYRKFGDLTRIKAFARGGDLAVGLVTSLVATIVGDSGDVVTILVSNETHPGTRDRSYCVDFWCKTAIEAVRVKGLLAEVPDVILFYRKEEDASKKGKASWWLPVSDLM